MLKRFIYALVGITLLFTATACSGQTKTVYVQATPSVTAPAAPTGTDGFLAQVRASGYVSSTVSDQDIVTVGENSCLLISQEGAATAIPQIFIMSQEAGVDPTAAGLVVGAAVKNICPENLVQVQAFLSNSSTYGGSA